MASWGETFKVHLTAGEQCWLLRRGRGEGRGSKMLQGSASTTGQVAEDIWSGQLDRLRALQASMGVEKGKMFYMGDSSALGNRKLAWVRSIHLVLRAQHKA